MVSWSRTRKTPQFKRSKTTASGDVLPTKPGFFNRARIYQMQVRTVSLSEKFTVRHDVKGIGRIVIFLINLTTLSS